MQSFNYVIKDELGIHARPAGLLVKECRAFKSSMMIKKGDKEVALSRIMALMGLGVKKGDEVVVTIEGYDEGEACKAIQTFFKENL